MEKITSLTEAQKARFPEFVKKWTDIGLSTEKANRKEAEEGIVEMYKIAGSEKPKIVWCDSPLSQGLTRMIVQKLKSEGKLNKKIGAPVRDSVRASVGDSVGASVWDSVGASVWDSVWDSVGDSGYGQHEAGWLAFYDFFNEVNGLKGETQKLSGIWKVSKNAGWYLPHKNICWISERHTTLHRNTEGQLHNDRGIALAYPDGWGIYALNGVRFPKELWEKVVSRKMPFADILKIVDIDQRKQAMKYGNVWDFIKNQNAILVDETVKIGAKDGRKIRYWLYRFPAGELFTKDVHYMIYDDSMLGAAMQHMQGVPEYKTVAEAMAWKQSDDLFTVTPERWNEMILDVDFS